MARIYIASTYEDLIDERSQVSESLQMMGHSVVCMERFAALNLAWPPAAGYTRSSRLFWIGRATGYIDRALSLPALENDCVAIRIKNTWHQSERNEPATKTLEANASALAFIAWRLALEGAKTLHREGYQYDSDRERVGVISEFVAFEIQLADRLVHEHLTHEERTGFVNALGLPLKTVS